MNGHDLFQGTTAPGRLTRAAVLIGAVGGLTAAAAALAVLGAREGGPVVYAGLAGIAMAMLSCGYLLLRSCHPSEAARLALTDPLTGLGNARHFLERLEHALDRADTVGSPVAVVLLDVDDFKSVNDRYGHPAGDEVLAGVAGCLRAGGEGFRVGGDEFALLLPGHSEAYGIAIAEAVLARISAIEFGHGGSVTVSAGVASYPAGEIPRSGLIRAADQGLYRAKRSGKDCVCTYEPGAGRAVAPRTAGADRAAYVSAAGSLALAVHARGLEGARIGEMAARIAARMGLPIEHVELIRLAADVSDVGKLALSDELLQKPGPLNDRERTEVERHPEIGHAMLDALGADALATWVRHHHERWDGAGYPARLAGERIPLAARILGVADALDAMTTDQTWRTTLTIDEALVELARCSGTQFDPGVVEAATAALGAEVPGREPLTPVAA